MNRFARVALTLVPLWLAACAGGDAVPVTEQTRSSADTTRDTASPPDSEAASGTGSLSPLSESEVVPEGFSTVLVEITEADGEVCEVCMWLADSADERGQGLMGVTSLGTPEGMAFVWEQPTAGAFFMFQTVTPLSIAWFAEPVERDAGGALVSTADMDPCLSDNAAECERFPAGGEFVLAIEVVQGDLASIGITDGATARLLPDTESTDCPLA